MTEPQRRASDSPIHGERLASLEATVKHTADVGNQTLNELRAHARDETHLFAEHSEAVTKLAVSQETMQHAINKIAEAVQSLSQLSTRITILEDFRSRVEPIVDEFAQKTDRMYWGIKGLWAIGGAVATVVLGVAGLLIKHLAGGGP